MSTYLIDDAAIGDDPSKSREDDKALRVRFTTEERLNHAMMTKITDINLAHESKAELLEVAGKFDEAKEERAKKLSDAPVYRKVEFVTIQIPGDKTLVVHRPVMAADKVRFRAQYEAFKNSTGEPVEGNQKLEVVLVESPQPQPLGLDQHDVDASHALSPLR